MARRRKRRSNPRGRRRRSALALLAPRRRRKRATRRNPPRARRTKARRGRRRRNPAILPVSAMPFRSNPRRKRRKTTRGRRRRNPPILWQSNPRRKRRRSRSNAHFTANPHRKRRASRRGRRRRNPPILWQSNPRGHRRKAKRRGRHRRNPDFSPRGIVQALKEAIPTFEDLKTVGIMTGFGLAQDMWSWKLFDMIGFPIWNYIPAGDQAVFTILGTAAAAILGGRSWARPVMYGGLSHIADGLAKKAILTGKLGASLQAQAKASSLMTATFADYVTSGDRMLRRDGTWGPVSDYVTFGNEDESAGAIECQDSFTVEPGGAPMADYYGVTAM